MTAAQEATQQSAQHHFASLPHDQQLQTVRRLVALGYKSRTIAEVTGLHVEQIRVLRDAAR